MRQDFLPFARPAITDDDIDAVVAVMRSGWVAGGPRAEALAHDDSRRGPL